MLKLKIGYSQGGVQVRKTWLGLGCKRGLGLGSKIYAWGDIMLKC
jgi:hypothetical protein